MAPIVSPNKFIGHFFIFDALSNSLTVPSIWRYGRKHRFNQQNVTLLYAAHKVSTTL